MRPAGLIPIQATDDEPRPRLLISPDVKPIGLANDLDQGSASAITAHESENAGRLG